MSGALQLGYVAAWRSSRSANRRNSATEMGASHPECYSHLEGTSHLEAGFVVPPLPSRTS